MLLNKSAHILLYLYEWKFLLITKQPIPNVANFVRYAKNAKSIMLISTVSDLLQSIH